MFYLKLVICALMWKMVMHMCGFYHAEICIINNILVVQVEVSYAVRCYGSYVLFIISFLLTHFSISVALAAENSHRKASQAVLC